MTRKDFTLVADAMHRGKPKPGSQAHTQWVRDVGELAYAFSNTFVRFNSTRFLDRCNEGPEQ